MLKFVIRKMLSKKWMVLSLLIGNILLISITSGNPMYTQAVLQRTLTKNLEAYLEEKNACPGRVTLKFSGNSKERATVETYDEVARAVPEQFGLNALETVRYMRTATMPCDLELQRDGSDNLRVGLATLSDMPEHIELVGGKMYSDAPDENGIIDVIVSERALVDKDLLLDDVLTFRKLFDPAGNPIQVRIAGVFKNSASNDQYWVRTPSFYREDCFVAPELFEQYFLGKDELEHSVNATWHILLDYTAMRGDRAQELLATAQRLGDECTAAGKVTYEDAFSGILTEYLKTAKKVQVTLWVLQVPIFMLLAAFIFMVSRQMLEMERNEIAVIKSRGAGRGQIFAIYLLQSVLISAVAFVVGVPLGAYLCQVVGSANAFLEFVRRSALPVEVNASALCYAALASLLSICAMVLPALRYSKTTIVNHKRVKNKRSSTPLWQKLGLDVILLGISLYGLYTFNGQKAELAARVQEGVALDPLLFLSSSLFMIGAGLLAVRVMPLIVWLIFRPLKRFWSPALYASFLRVLRTRSSQGFIMVFLIMTIALGVFNAQAARTINQNAEDNLRYAIGADVVLKENWDSNASTLKAGEQDELVYYEPDIGRYEALDGIESFTKVYVNDGISVSIKGGGTLKNAVLMGIHTKEFGETAWMKDSLTDVHWYNYLNAMSQNSRAVLVSSNFRTDYGYELGDSINYRGQDSVNQRGIIYGFVDYFPGYEPVSYSRDTDGRYKETDRYLIVGNLQQIQSAWGIEPYQIWIKNRGSSAYLYDFAEESRVDYAMFKDFNAQLIETKNDPVLQGTNGILTVGFIVVLLLCTVGFLIYWILSIQSRALQFGIFRAMGMSMREVISMLLNEQLYISGLSIATGALVGHWTAKLYMPLIQLAYAASDNALPLEVISRQTDAVRLFVVIGAMILICMVILSALISRMKIAQALKLGED